MHIRNACRSRGMTGWSSQLTATVSAMALSLGLTAWPMPGHGQEAATAEAATISFNIPAQDLNRAILSFANRAGVQVFYDISGLRGLRSHPVSGSMTAGQALSQLLSGTGVSYSFTGPRAISLVLPGAVDLGADGEDVVVLGTIYLDSVTVSSLGAMTEGTDSYTTSESTGSARLPLTLRETPQSVTVLTRQRLDDQQLRSVKDALAYSTGVDAFNTETDRAGAYARGFAVGSYVVDGVPMDSGYGFFSGATLLASNAMYDRVEVLRGPSGLLQGSGEPGAGVHMVRKRATAREREGYAELRFGSWNQVGGTLDMSQPLNEDGSIRARLVLDRSSTDSFRDRYHLDQEVYFLTAEADIGDRLTLTFGAEHREHNPTGSEWGGWSPIYSNGTPTNFDRSFSNSTDWSYWASKNDTAFIRGEYAFDNGWKADASLSATKMSYDANLLYLWAEPDYDTGVLDGASRWRGEAFNRQIGFNANIGGPLQLFGREHMLNFGVDARRDWSREASYTTSTPASETPSVYDWYGQYPRLC